MISKRLQDLRKEYRLTEEAYELVEWTKDNRCYCSACSMPPCSSCENGLPEDIAYEYDEYWEVDPEYEEEEDMSRVDIKDTSNKTTSSDPPFKVGDEVERIASDSLWLKRGGIYTIRSINGDTLKVKESTADYNSFEFKLVEPKFHTAYVTFKDSHSYKEYAYKISDELYQQVNKISKTVGVLLEVQVGDKLKEVNLVRMVKDYIDPIASKEIKRVIGEESKLDKEEKVEDNVPISKFTWPSFSGKGYGMLLTETSSELTCYAKSVQTNINQQEESKMSNVNQVKRRVLNIQLLDNDAGLDIAHALVGEFNGVVAEDSNEVVLQEIISTGEVAKLIEAHNKVRAEQIDMSILERTGNSVKLRPIKLKNLTWEIK